MNNMERLKKETLKTEKAILLNSLIISCKLGKGPHYSALAPECFSPLHQPKRCHQMV